MKKIAVVYWSGTGNTESLANAIAKSIRNIGNVADVYKCSDFSESKINNYDSIAFGCPAMGSETLEESEFEPMFESCEASLSGKNIALFGSYGWGGGEWMTTWEERCKSLGANLVCDSVICADAPDDLAISQCDNLASSL